MNARADAAAAFLEGAGWAEAARAPLAGDASRRRYVRLSHGVERRILMDSPPGPDQDIEPFLAVAEMLRDRGLSVPAIEARDLPRGFLLMEDLGDDTYTRHLTHAPEDEPALYAAAAEALARMQADPPPDALPDYLPRMPDLAALAVDWYAPGGDRAALAEAVAETLRHRALAEPALVHRDYHADNLLWLPERDGVRRVGLLDFQDAMRGPREYDLASLIHDPRRAVTQAARDAALDAWRRATGRDAETVAAGVAITSAQRCLRILGVFARLCLRDGKPRYADFIPATWDALGRDLRHPALGDLAAVVHAMLPAPDPARLEALRARAGTMAGLARAEA